MAYLKTCLCQVFYYKCKIYEGGGCLEDLVKRAKKGDSEAFTNLILSIRNDLYKLSKARLSNEDDIQDVIQETMIEAYQKLYQLRDVSKFKFWIIRILINNCNKKYNKSKKEDILNEPYEESNYPVNCDNMDIVENTLDFYKLISPLDSDERLIIILYYNENYTTKEISKILSMKENTVKSKLFRAKDKIKNNCKGGIKYV